MVPSRFRGLACLFARVPEIPTAGRPEPGSMISNMIENPLNTLRIASDVQLGKRVKLHGFVNLYGCEVGDETQIGCFVEIQKGAKIGPRCKISSHVFICEGVTLEAEVFVGHGVTFVNDRWPRAAGADGTMFKERDWNCLPTLVKKGASIGSGSTILGGLVIGENSMVGAGSVVTKNVQPDTTVAGNPARPLSPSQPGDHR